MFTSLHALAKQATLMITIAPEGADQLRVNVTPMPLDSKAKAGMPQPLSLVATPAEFDADFITALGTWQAPKRTLVQQAQDAAGGAAAAPASADAPKLPAPKEKQKAGRKAKSDKPTGADDAGPSSQAEATGADDAAPGGQAGTAAGDDGAGTGPDQVDIAALATDEPAAEPAPVVAAAGLTAADLTLDLF
jgi:PRTRC genetic system protein E